MPDDNRTQVLTVHGDRVSDYALASIAIVTLCGAKIAMVFDDGEPTRPTGDASGSLQCQCTITNAPRVKAGLVRVGFQIIEPVGPLTTPIPTKLVQVQSAQPNKTRREFGDVPADALCGARMTAEYPDGRSYNCDL